ncbi:MAG: SpoIIIAC/SpoIIIAD family protein [Eubacteriales bacterium]|nr:SpoIIIAC/SpoIIIAD family protein [Eubacteriales bacterium]
MEMGKLAGVAVTAAVLCVAVRRQQPELSALCAAAAGALLLLWALDTVGAVRDAFRRVAALSGLKEDYVAALLKVMGVTCVAELAAQTCADLGENGLAAKASLCGKLAVYALAAPMLMSLLEMILGMTP